jgi:MFS transporter, FHS family, L-fucose permease
MTNTKLSKKGNTLLIPLLIVGVLFFVIGFGVGIGIGISGFLTPFLKDALHLTVTQSYLVTAAIFSAFVVFGTPAG